MSDPIGTIAAWAAEAERASVYSMSEAQEAGWKSPIERIFMVAMFAVARHQPPLLPLIWYKDAVKFSNPDGLHIPIFPQWRVPSTLYTVDFALKICDSLGDWPGKTILVECDGHEFHYQSKDQIEKDRDRDRLLQILGFPVFRFTGRELWRDPIRCAMQVQNWLFEAMLGPAR